MSRKVLMNSAAMLALIVFGGTSQLSAQQTTQAEDPTATPAPQTQATDAAPAETPTETPAETPAEAPATESPAPSAPSDGAPGSVSGSAQIPQILQGDGFADVTSRQGPRGGMLVQGSIAATGKDFDAMIGRDGSLLGIRTAEGSSLPDELVNEMVPEAARSHPVTSEITELSAIGTRGDAVMLAGQDASGDEVRIGFDENGELIHFSRGEDRMGPGGHGDKMRDTMRGDKMRGDGDRGPRAGGDRAPRDSGAREGGPRDAEPHDGGPRDGGPRDGGPRDGGRGDGPRNVDPRDGAAGGDAPRPSPEESGAPSEEGALRGDLEDAGYADLGRFVPTADGATVDAVNPQGEPVTLTLDAQGEVVEETAR